ncbi:MAG: hypothetical protein D6702_07755 [Planctomycetota bacterium]|nr:MAG: hypothetical protein D6702_07755 [Planctomycetota bacterium]
MVRRAEYNEDDLRRMMLRLREATRQPQVRLVFRDGHTLEGAITFVERFGTGRLINIEQEVAENFNIYELERVEF